ncbi:hypothetical protein LKL35_11520 [Streptomyces sp. ET3-23]|uniref:terpene synthase family protein n=1 Tax=Streptomyces sp. ET3-23 TaxID=2885643 RepID=UPI001D11FF5D|nr:hypothetical protein [Streptomyces sp. ET3-23]MCC2276041.1 hypothetical protein [Streptomyces sp. ET3-23]
MTAPMNIPFPCASNPHLDRVREDNISWMLERELLDSGPSLERYRAGDFPELYCYVYPYAEYEDIRLLVDFEMFMFLYDDQFAGARGENLEDAIDAMGEFMSIMYGRHGAHGAEDAQTGLSRLGRAFSDILPRMTDGMSAGWCRQFFWSCQRFFVSYIHEAENRLRKNEAIDLNLYLKQRQWALGVEPSIDAIERGGRFEIAEQIRSHPIVLGMREDVNYFVALTNDIDSLHKEEFTGDVNNSVFLLERYHRMDHEEAVGMVTGMAQEAVDRFRRRHEMLRTAHQYKSLPHEVRADTDRYVAGLQNWISGYYKWTKHTGRYAAENVEREAEPWTLHELLRETPWAGPSPRRRHPR